MARYTVDIRRHYSQSDGPCHGLSKSPPLYLREDDMVRCVHELNLVTVRKRGVAVDLGERTDGSIEPFEGEATGQIYMSTSYGKYGGAVIRLETLDHSDTCNMPYAINTELGVEIHIAGDLEFKAFVKVIRKLLSK